MIFAKKSTYFYNSCRLDSSARIEKKISRGGGANPPWSWRTFTKKNALNTFFLYSFLHCEWIEDLRARTREVRFFDFYEIELKVFHDENWNISDHLWNQGTKCVSGKPLDHSYCHLTSKLEGSELTECMLLLLYLITDFVNWKNGNNQLYEHAGFFQFICSADIVSFITCIVICIVFINIVQF